MCEIFDFLLICEGCQVMLVFSGEEAFKIVKIWTFDVVVVDIMMLGIDGIVMFEELKWIDEELFVVIIMVYGIVVNMWDAFKCGVFDFVEKFFKNDDVLLVVWNVAV